MTTNDEMIKKQRMQYKGGKMMTMRRQQWRADVGNDLDDLNDIDEKRGDDGGTDDI